MKEDRTTLVPLLVAAAAFAGVTYPHAANRSPADVAPPAAHAAATGRSHARLDRTGAKIPGPACYHDARTLVQEFVGGSFASAATLTGADCQRCVTAKWLATDLGLEQPPRLLSDCDTCLGGLEHGSTPGLSQIASDGEFDTQFLIATVPDPIDAHVGWEFDEYVDSIQRGAEANNFVLDRYSLPWECDRQALDTHGDSNEQSHGTTDGGRLHESEPGVLLFREQGRQRLLLVYLIGETPTAGIHKVAFETALNDIDAALKDQSHTNLASPRFRIAGPSFSGSIDSLRVVIRNWLQAHPPSATASGPLFTIVSGSATLASNKQALELIGPHAVEFAATVASDDTVQSAMEQYLNSQGVPPETPVAVLTEGTSAYGADVHRQRWTRLPFPMHISQLRAAADRSARNDAKANTDSAPIRDTIDNARRPAIELSLDDSGEASDVPPTFHGEISNPGAELAIASILSAISRNGAQYVGILATDVRDTLFLARQVHKYAPDVRLFTFSNSALFAYPMYQDDLQGMIILSSYPLWPESQWLINGAKSGQLIQFSSDALEGAYNAVAALLAEDTQAEEQESRLLDYTTPLSQHPAKTPPVWISVMGRGAPWPLAYCDTSHVPDADAAGGSMGPSLHCDSNGYMRPAGTAAVPGERKNSAYWVISHRLFAASLVLMLWAGCLAAALGYFGVVYGDHTWRPFALFRPIAEPAERRWQAVYIFAFFAVLFVLYACVARVILLVPAIGRALEVASEHPNRWIALAVVPAVFLGAVMNSELLAIVGLQWFVKPLLKHVTLRLQRWTANAVPEPPGSWGYTLLIGLLAALSLVIAYAGRAYALWFVEAPWLDKPSMDVLAAFLFFDRTMTFSSGLSPGLPVLFLCMAWMTLAICHLRRTSLAGRREVHSPFFVSTVPGAAGLRRLESEVLGAIWRPFWGRTSAIPMRLTAVVVMGLAVALALNSRLQSFEGRMFTVVFGLAGIGAVVLLALVFLHFVYIWFRFHRYLRRLPLHPMASVYSRLPRHPRAFGGDFGTKAPGVSDLEVPMSHWSVLARTFDQVAAEVPAEAAEAIRKQIDCAGEHRTQFEHELTRAARKGNEDVGATVTAKYVVEVGRDLLKVLDHFWKGAPLVRDSAKKKEAIPVTKPTLRLYAEIGGDDKLGRWLRLAEDFIGIQVLQFLNYTFAHLRNLLGSVLVSLLLLLLAVTSYPFEPQKLLLTVLCMAIIAVVVFTVYVFVQVERDEILSRVAGTEPNRVTFNRSLVGSLFLYAALPLGALMATVFPPLGDLFSFADPILKFFK